MGHEEFLNQYIPSADMKRVIRETEFGFSDWDKAAIIWNSEALLEEKLNAIGQIADETPDVNLKEQIQERIAYEQRVIMVFREISAGFTYMLTAHEDDDEDSMKGCFADPEMAYEEGCKLGSAFSVTKHQIIEKGVERIKSRIILSPIFAPKEADQIRELDDYADEVARIEYDEEGSILYCFSDELPKEYEIKVNSLSNKRFENRYVIFPQVFWEHEKVCVVGGGYIEGEIVGWIPREPHSYDWYIRRGSAPDSIYDYDDAMVRVDYWDDDDLAWSHLHILPIYLDHVEEDLCNSFDETGSNQVIIGHDQGAAVWIQVAEVEESERILSDDVKDVGLEISVHAVFFDAVLRPVFLMAFDSEMLLNKNRFTYGLCDEGQYLRKFEERTLEYNFFTFDQMTAIINWIEDLVKDGAKRIENEINGTDAIQLITFTEYVRHIMEEYPEHNIISVMS